MLMGMGHPNPAGILDYQPDVGGQLHSEETFFFQHISMCSGLKPNVSVPEPAAPLCRRGCEWQTAAVLAGIAKSSSRCCVLGVLPAPICRRLHREAACVDCRLQ